MIAYWGVRKNHVMNTAKVFTLLDVLLSHRGSASGSRLDSVNSDAVLLPGRHPGVGETTVTPTQPPGAAPDGAPQVKV
jgi:hypothetical protein